MIPYRTLFPGLFLHTGGIIIPPWWLEGGILPAQCAAAYRAIATPGSIWGPGPANIAASYINLNNPGVNNAAPGVAPLWAAATGWTFDGATQYLDTTVVHAQNWSLIVQYANAPVVGSHTVAGGWDLGVPTTKLAVTPVAGANQVGYDHGGNRTVIPLLATGNLCVADGQGYRNGVANGAAFGGWVGVNTVSIGIGAAYCGGAFCLDWCAAEVRAVAIYNATLTGPQVLALATAMAAL